MGQMFMYDWYQVSDWACTLQWLPMQLQPTLYVSHLRENLATLLHLYVRIGFDLEVIGKGHSEKRFDVITQNGLFSGAL